MIFVSSSSGSQEEPMIHVLFRRFVLLSATVKDTFKSSGSLKDWRT
jgi:hypothetical protein